MLVTYDHLYRVRDLYYPHVGQENHGGGGPCRFGVWANLPDAAKKKNERRRKRLYWSDEQWDIDLRYQPDTLATDVTMSHEDLKLTLRCSDAVDFHRPVMVRRIEVENGTDTEREVRLFHHQDFNMFGTKVGDTAFYDPMIRSIVHYRKDRYLMTCFYLDGEQQIDEYATGTSGFHGAEGTWRDAEDGKLGNNPIAQGAVDSTMMCRVLLPAGGKRIVYMVIGCGKAYREMEAIHRFIHREGPQGVIDRTVAYWRLWLAAMRADVSTTRDTGLSEATIELFKRSLLIVRSQIDNSGAIIAANDSDIMQFSRDTYSYLWPRDGAFVADGLDAAGFPDVARSFFKLSSNIITDGGFFLHKYNPDGSLASSWHPWVANGKPQLPIQEDETALVIWALWRHYVRYRDIEFVRSLWMTMIKPAADFLVRYRDPASNLPLPSYDLWEERWGVHAFTVATVYAGLRAAWQFAVCFGDTPRAENYSKACDEMQDAFGKHMWSEKHGRFLRRITPINHDRTAALVAEVRAGRSAHDIDDVHYDAMPGNGTTSLDDGTPVEFELDEVIDASMYAIFSLGLLPVDDPRVEKTMAAIESELWVKTDVGGVARYTDDYYHQVTKDTDKVPGNPWYICTLWLAEYYIARATDLAGLKEALPIIEWAADHALPSGALAEQVHPETNAPLSVCPLTWSHATVVSVVTKYLNKLDSLTLDPTGKLAGQAEPLELIRRTAKPR